MAISSDFRRCCSPLKVWRLLAFSLGVPLFVLMLLSVDWFGAGQVAAQTQAPANPPAGTISGHIYRGDTTTPAVGIVISLLSIPQNGAAVSRLDIFLQTIRTGPDGAYKFSSESPGTYRVHVIKGSGFSPREPSQTVTLVAGQSVDNIDLRIQSFGTISGTVLDEDNDPVKGMFAIVFSSDPSARPGDPVCFGTAQTDDRGRFRLSGIPPSNCYVAVAADQPLGARIRPADRAVYYPDAASLQGARVVQVKAGEEVSNLLFHIPLAIIPPAGPFGATQIQPPSASAGSVGGHIYRADTHAPLPGAVIRLYHASQGPPVAPGQPRLLPLVTRSGPDGTFTFSSVEPGPYRIKIERYGFSPAQEAAEDDRVTVDAGQAVTGVDAQLKPTGAISGSIRDQNDTPVEGIGVTVLCSPEGNGGTGGGLTDDQGNYRVYGLPPGDCRVGIRSTLVGPNAELGYHAVYYRNADSMDKAQFVHVVAGSEITNIDLTLRFSPTYRITVKILGDGASDNHYLVSGGGGPVLTGPDGTAQLRGVMPGVHAITVQRATVRDLPNGRQNYELSGVAQSVGSAVVQVVDGDVNVEIPISSFPDGGR